MSAMYTAVVTANGGRSGSVKSQDGNLSHELVTPKEMGGNGGEGTNPEELFAAGYAACFGSALDLVITKKRLKDDVTDTAVTAHISLNKDESDNGFKLSAELQVKIDGVDQDTAIELVKAAHQVCPYSKATRGNIDVKLKVIQ